MEFGKKVISRVFWLALITLAIYVLIVKRKEMENGMQAFHLIAYWLPAIGLLSIISGQIDLLYSIKKGGQVNIKARMYDFIHWLLLVCINIGAWMIGGVTIAWFILQLGLLAIIGWQIGIGLKSRLEFTTSDIKVGILFASIAFLLGLAIGSIRYLDKSNFGFGWVLELVGAVIATMIVFRWIILDLKIIRRDFSGYPRAFFIKCIFSNTLVLCFWVSIMTRVQGGFADIFWWGRNLGLSFNVIVGNVLFWGYWAVYERCRKKQKVAKIFSKEL